MSMDTDYLDKSNFYLEDNKIRLRIDYESMNKSLVLFIDKDKIRWIKKYKELLGYTKDKYHLAIIYITPDVQTMIDESDDFILSGDIVFYYGGKYKEKIKLLFENNLEKSVKRLESSLSSIHFTNSTDTKKQDDSDENTAN